MNHPILPLDVKNSNGRVYPAIELEKAVAALAGKTLHGSIGYAEEGKPLPKPVIEASNFRVDGDMLRADLKFLSSHAMEMVETGEAVVRPFGTGQVNEKGEVIDYTLQSLAIIPADQDAFKNSQD